MSGLTLSDTARQDSENNTQVHIIADDTQIALINSLDVINTTITDIDTWSNSKEGSIQLLTSDQISNSATNIKSIRICYVGSNTIFLQLHNKILSTPFSNSTLIGMGYEISVLRNDLVINFDSALQFTNGLAWTLNSTKFIYTTTSETAYVFIQFRSI